MTTRGYDPRAVKISKSVKRMSANILDDHKRGQFIKSYVKILEEQARNPKKDK